MESEDNAGPDDDVAWQTWLNIRVTADKYLEPKLSEVADKKYREAALTRTNADDIFDVLEMIRVEMSHDESLVAFGETIRKTNLGKLLKNARFREHLDRGGKEALWAQLDELTHVADLEEKWTALCYDHKRAVFKSPDDLRLSYKHRCTLCSRKSTAAIRMWISKHVAEDQ